MGLGGEPAIRTFQLFPCLLGETRSQPCLAAIRGASEADEESSAASRSCQGPEKSGVSLRRPSLFIGIVISQEIVCLHALFNQLAKDLRFQNNSNAIGGVSRIETGLEKIIGLAEVKTEFGGGGIAIEFQQPEIEPAALEEQ